MRSALGALILFSASTLAAPTPLRFAITDSWAMPMVQIEQGRPTQGILHDTMLSLATQVGMPAEFHVLARARVQNAMEHGEVDIRCYAAQSWLPNQSSAAPRAMTAETAGVPASKPSGAGRKRASW